MSSASKSKKQGRSSDLKKEKTSSHVKKEKKESAGKLSFIEKMDRIMANRLPLILYVSVFFTVFFGAFMFDVKISTGGDDSGYIEMAHNFLKGISFPSWHGSFYSVFLSLPIAIFGVHVVFLKLISFACIIAHLLLFYYTFRKHFSPALFSLILLVVSTSSAVLYFASQTYSEALFMFLQSWLVLLFVRFIVASGENGEMSYKNQLKSLIPVAFVAFLISLTRNIGVVAILAMLVFLVIKRRYVTSLLLTASYIIFFIPYKIYKALVWDIGFGETSGQVSEILLKDAYNKAEGYEDVSGMFTRFFENARLYLSKHFMIGIGLHDPTTADKSWFVTFVVLALLLIALFYSFKRNKIMLFVALYAGGSLAATFIALQTSWDQMRLVVVYIPLMLLLVSWGILQLSHTKGYGFLQVVLVGFLVLVFFKTLGQTLDKVKDNRTVLAQNMKGNMYYGFTPDWQNFLKMSEWVGENIPDSVNVVSRKSSMSFIYSKGHEFYGIYKLPQSLPNELVGQLRTNYDDLIAVLNKDLDHLPTQKMMLCKNQTLAFVIKGDEVYGVYSETDQLRDAMNMHEKGSPIKTTPVDSLLTQIEKSGQSNYAISPDSLLARLVDNHVQYAIIANLRANPKANTGRTINTVQRYMYFIEQKYPGIFSVVNQIGANNEEPTLLYKINYGLYNL